MFAIDKENLTKLKYHIFKKKKKQSFYGLQCGHEYKKSFQEEESNEILIILECMFSSCHVCVSEWIHTI